MQAIGRIKRVQVHLILQILQTGYTPIPEG